MNQDLVRQLTKKSRHWQRLQREKVMQRTALQNHSREYAHIINLEKSSAKQENKIHHMRRS